jgi:hypothetical protein
LSAITIFIIQSAMLGAFATFLSEIVQYWTAIYSGLADHLRDLQLTLRVHAQNFQAAQQKAKMIQVSL